MFYSNINIFHNKINKITNVFEYIESFVARKQSRGVFMLLPIGIIIKDIVESTIEKHIKQTKPIKLISPSLIEQILYEKSGRLEIFGKEIYSMKDRYDKKLLLSPTMEEVFLNLIPDKTSYKNLPFFVYQNTHKYRDETRVRNSLLRSCEFLMHDGYYFARNKQESLDFYNKMAKIYENIFDELDISYIQHNPEPDQMLEKESLEFLNPNEISETKVEIDSKKIDAIEIAHIFNLSTIYSERMNIRFIDKNNILQNIHMSSYGIGISRIIFLISQKIFNGKKGLLNLFFAFIPRKDNYQEIIDLYFKYENYSIYFDTNLDLKEMFDVANIISCIYSVSKYNEYYEILNNSSNELIKIKCKNELVLFLNSAIEKTRL